MKFLKRLLAGIPIGIGAAIPGVSGAAIAVIFKIYEEIIHSVDGFTKHLGYSLKVLIPILLGIIIAVIPCIYLFSLAFEYLMFVLICVFAGFLIGSLPGITDEVKGKKPTRKQWIIISIAIIFVICLGIASVFLGPQINIDKTFTEMPWWLYIVLVPVGALAAVALTVPGLSGSLILLVIGFYRPLVDHARDWASEIIKQGNFSNTGKLVGMILCFALGCIIGVVVVSKIMTKLLKKAHDSTYFAIIGFVIGSIFVLFFNYEIYKYYQNWAGIKIEGVNPILSIGVEIPIGIVVLIICVFLSYLMVRYQRKYIARQKENEIKQKE